MIALDLSTVLFLDQSSLLAGAAVFLLVRRRRTSSRGFGTLASAFALLGLGATLAALGEGHLLPLHLWTMGSLTLGMLGHGLLVVGLERLRSGRPPPAWRLLAVYTLPLWVVGWITNFHPESDLRAIVFHLNAALCLVLASRSVDRLRRLETLPSCVPLRAVLALSALAYACGAGVILLADDPVPWLALEFFVQILGNFLIAILIYSIAADRAERKLGLMADVDSLTGIGNRRSLDKTVPKTLRSGDTVFFVDLDHFKRLNDRFGHGIGDEALVAVAATLSAVKRPNDVVARMGGEEFLLFLPDLEVADALAIAERLRKAIADIRIHHHDTVISMTASIGVAQVQQADQRWLDLVHDADMALYAAKSEGRNRVVLAPAA